MPSLGSAVTPKFVPRLGPLVTNRGKYETSGWKRGMKLLSFIP